MRLILKKTKPSFFTSKGKIEKVPKVVVIYNNIRTKQYYRVIYLCFILDETMSGESLAQIIVSKVNASLFRMKSEQFIMQHLNTAFSLCLLCVVS